MAYYNEHVAERLRKIFEDRDDIVEKKMFGGIAFMLSGNMWCGGGRRHAYGACGAGST